MARRRRAEKREVEPDSRYGSKLVTLLVNFTMRRGKKSVAEKIIYGAFDKLAAEKQGSDPLEVLERAVGNARPRLEVKSRRVGGATYQIPLEISSSRQTALALRWMVSFSQARKGVTMKDALATEIRDASEGQGSCIRKRDEMHKMAQANKAFAHFRWLIVIVGLAKRLATRQASGGLSADETLSEIAWFYWMFF